MSLTTMGQPYPEPPTDNARLASQAVERYRRRVEAVRQDTRLSEPAKAKDVRDLYREVQEEVEGYREADRAAFEARTEQLQRLAFGLGSGVTSGTDAISARDASDRAAAIPFNQQDEALELMERARMNGDVILEKAVAAQAHRQGWGTVTDAYGANHLEFQPRLAELETIRGLPTDLGYVSYFYLTAPPEGHHAFDITPAFTNNLRRTRRG